MFRRPISALASGLLFLGSTVLAASPIAADESGRRLVVHEWGTFTSLQDETGRAVAGINSDEEPLPAFVHRLADDLLLPPSQLAPVFYKGVPRVHRDVTMRLETPVIYFHLPQGADPLKVDVSVRFRGGWLSEHYPNARVGAPGLEQGRFRFGAITSETIGSLDWEALSVGGRPDLPETDSHVWLAPRQVNSAPVRTTGGEAEQYLFYRGVGHVDSPLAVTRDQAGRLSIRERFDRQLFGRERPQRLSTTLWLAHIREDGAVAFRSLGAKPLTLEEGRELATTPATFHKRDFSRDNLPRLRADMLQALVADGLFADEATALLETWELGYFKSAGLRLFFLLPQEWTEAVLPLDVSVPADVSRTMVGRIEMVTPRDRKLLRQISAAPLSEVNWLHEAAQRDGAGSERLKLLWEGKARLSDARLPMPADYQAYVGLGRFRNALILDEHTRRGPAAGLTDFVEQYRIGYFEPEN